MMAIGKKAQVPKPKFQIPSHYSKSLWNLDLGI
jgi:hypothetical protein